MPRDGYIAAGPAPTAGPGDWSRLEELAARLSRQGVSATAGHVASVMVHRQLELLGSSPARHRRAAR